MEININKVEIRETIADKLRRGEVLSMDCPSRLILNHLTSRWAVLVMIVLLEDTYRFSELRRKVGGISEKMLTQTLQTLEGDGFILRRAYPVIPPHVEYSLTPLGKQASSKITLLGEWIEENLPEILAAQNLASQNKGK